MKSLPASTAGKRLRPNVRGRTDGKFTLQDKQKQDSRERVLEAAQAVLLTHPYALITVEDITIEAKVSRGTFYRHFDSKLAVFLELHKPMKRYFYKLFDQLASVEKPDIDSVSRWLESISAYYLQEKVLIAAVEQIACIEPGFFAINSDMQEEICRRLGKAQPAFKMAFSSDPRASEAKAAAYLLLAQINHLCMENEIHRWNIDRHDSIKIVARNVCDFIKSYRS